MSNLSRNTSILLAGATFVALGAGALYATHVLPMENGPVAGTILPFSFHPDLQLMADPRIRESAELFFNAARLDRSMALRTEDFLAIATPRFESIAAVESGEAAGFTAADRAAP